MRASLVPTWLQEFEKEAGYRRRMNIWKRFWSNPYRWGLWHWVGGRQWTYIMRDFAYQNPMLVLFLGFGLGVWLHTYLEWRDLIVGSVCLLLAHLFWGTKWRRGQGKDGKVT